MRSRQFLIRALGLMAVFYAAYYYPYAPDGAVAGLLDDYLRFVARTAGAVVGLFDEHVVVVDRSIRGRFALQIVKSCSSLDVQALGAAAVLAFPATLPAKLVGLAGSVAALTIANQLRIATLYFVGINAPTHFDLIHEELFPLALLALAVGAFFLWTRWAQRRTLREPHAAGPRD